MESYWHKFIRLNKSVLPYIALSTILEAFYWFVEGEETNDNSYLKECKSRVSNLMEELI